MRNKFYSLINIVGLAIGISACILILLYVQSEISYDKFHDKADRIYRVNLFAVLSDDNINQPVTNPPLARVMQNEIPEVEEAVRITNFSQPVIRHNDDVFNETEWYFADANFFKIFTAPFIIGNPENALAQPNSVVLTESTAKRYFGENNPVGQFLTWENDRDYLITGVIHDFPQNSHIKPDFLASIKGQKVDNNMEWINNMVYTYFLMKEGFTKQDVDAKLEGLVTKYVGPTVKQYMGVSFEDFLAQGAKYRWYAQPISEIHFDRDVSQGPEPLGNKSYMLIFSIIAVFILVIACINYMNMSTARSAKRAKEVGIKKALGSNHKSLVIQFLSESIFVTLIALVLALVLIKLMLQGFNSLIDKQLVFYYFNNFKTIPLMILFGIGIGIIAGSYPAFFLASFNPVKVIKGVHKSEGSQGKLRSGLVIFQLIVSIILFSGAFLISKQLSFLQNKELGFNKENLVVINKANYLGNRMSSFKNELLAQSGILQITNTSSVPGRINTSSTFFHHSANDPRGMNNIWTDCDFIKTYEVELKEGRFFEEGNPSNARSVVLNELAVKRLDIEDPIGKKLYQQEKTDEDAYTIIGVMKDFNCESLHQEMSSLVIFNGNGENLTVRIAGGELQQSLKTIQQTWDKFANGQSLDFVFFDEDFGRLYNAEVRTRKIVTIFSGLAILIACLGLLALAAFVAEQRTKEIGVRKVNGARIGEILLSLNRNFMKWVGIAFVIAVPGAWYLLNNWLENFAYKTNLSWWVFALAGLAALILTIITVSWISWKAATKNPVEALRYE
ncbi:ABC transporter permease [Draconibacterium halophilum]|uniref:FtsX-like permease family protein n=1 Tax=Draconibacterium halophilum TaxID=2706887 RepID=A0A6C0RBN7_9BACT|nr:ABC transporter permease [Draconibacterium halophilum]QIA06591.1 FtsX-like permease family protein [Draconibacterium halophilum]